MVFSLCFREDFFLNRKDEITFLFSLFYQNDLRLIISASESYKF